eukprot:1331975-Pleurochrysis_carterae.AAC.2
MPTITSPVGSPRADAQQRAGAYEEGQGPDGGETIRGALGCTRTPELFSTKLPRHFVESFDEGIPRMASL